MTLRILTEESGTLIFEPASAAWPGGMLSQLVECSGVICGLIIEQFVITAQRTLFEAIFSKMFVIFIRSLQKKT